MFEKTTTTAASVVLACLLSACIGTSADPAMPPDAEQHTPDMPSPTRPDCGASSTSCL